MGAVIVCRWFFFLSFFLIAVLSRESFFVEASQMPAHWITRHKISVWLIAATRVLKRRFSTMIMKIRLGSCANSKWFKRITSWKCTYDLYVLSWVPLAWTRWSRMYNFSLHDFRVNWSLSTKCFWTKAAAAMSSNSFRPVSAVRAVQRRTHYTIASLNSSKVNEKSAELSESLNFIDFIETLARRAY